MTTSLSPEARERLGRPPPPPLRPPPMDDVAAVAAWRAAIHEAWLAGDPSAASLGHHRVEIAGVPCLRTSHPDGPVVVYLHGGGYALGSSEVSVPITVRLAPAAEVVSVDYRLAPEHPFPAALADAATVAATVADEGRPVWLAGDSAGANLAVGVALTADVATAGLLLLSPHLDHRPESGGGSPDVDAEAAAWLRRAYLRDTSPDDPRVSPILADEPTLARLPPTLIQVGGVEPLRPSVERFAERVNRSGGGPVTTEVWKEMWHTWHYHRIPEADRALSQARRCITER